jgi:hypothetical protein
MASFTGVGDNVELFVADRGEDVSIDISGTYNMTIAFQKEVGSKGSGAWHTIDNMEYSTANATVAETYRTKSYGENLRLIVLVDTSGTATATLADSSDKTLEVFVDEVDNLKATRFQSGMQEHGDLTVDGDLIVTGGFTPGLVNVTASTLTVTAAEHAGKTIALNRAAGIAVTMPAATGTGNVYKFVVGTTFTGAASIKSVAGTDLMVGGAILGNNTDNTVVRWPSVTADTNDTIDLFGTSNSTGGIEGQVIVLTDISATQWQVEIVGDAAGTEASPFADTVA